ncbi:LytTR family DNA-binding domain-containing protein [Marinigracilibium pacificum]|uniref:LytTR family transcriptional regulator n=1 Tax=Marinigracilibium pacificum TaxID=2729599 RepID=A0A848IWR3_9BACT|nr:LytTR family DNA-binding domain-containing protein [Marinigracilibium pacificum]NMM47608.1 LytTR family transcriptional regulator [Marinigracilibium pacificum]
MFFQLNRSIAFTSSWISTILIGIILSLIIVFILVFLQPFDTYSQTVSFKVLKLTGYSLCIIAPVILIHIPELFIFKKRNQKWFLIDEIITIIFGFILMSSLSFAYNTIVINNDDFNLNYLYGWVKMYGLPFAPIVLPFWIFLRSKFSKITISATPSNNSEVIRISGSNNNEEISFKQEDFILAQSQSNYVEISILDDNKEIQKHVIRTTLSSLIDQIPGAQQVHRSYLLNTSYIESISGNSRKGWVTANHIKGDIPVSPKHFKALKNHLQIRP